MVLGDGTMASYRNGMNELKELRERAKLSQAAFAKRLRTQQPQVTRWEKQPDEPDYRCIPMEKAKLAAEVLDVPLWRIRPDILSTDSIDLLLEGSSKAFKKEVRDFILFRQKQKD